MPTIINSKLDPINPVACPSIETAPENITILEVNNLLSDWPAYVINYTLDNPGPIKIILRVKDVQKYIWMDEESEDEQSKPAKKEKHHGAAVTIDFTGIMQQANPNMKQVGVDATPIHLYGILKDSDVIKKRKTFGEGAPEITWPPPRSRAFREVSTNQSTSAYCALQGIPALVTAVVPDGANKENGHGKDNITIMSFNKESAPAIHA